MQAPATILLFDLDGTLVLTGGVGRRAMANAFAELHGKRDVFEDLSFAGMTDRAIARHGLRRVLDEIPASEIDRFLDAYLRILESELPKADGYQVLPGVVTLINSLASERDHALGLGTGNIRRGAYAKLARAEIGEAFTFGGFGCDAEDRTELLRTGAERGAAKLGRPLSECRIVVIGDTPKDVAAAKGIGATCVAVATGGFTCEQLLACGAEHVFATLAEEGVRDVLVGAVPTAAR